MPSVHEIHEAPGNMSTASENYLEVIFELSMTGQPVRSVDVAKLMGVSKASVNKAIGVLRGAGMVEQELYGSIQLTPEGLQRAKEVAQRHGTIKRFLTEVLGIDEATAEGDACRMEHVVTETTMRAWSKYVERELSDSKTEKKQERSRTT